MKLALMAISAIFLLGGCAATQQITKLQGGDLNNLCIVKHDAVKEGVLVALQDEFSRNGINTVVVDGHYQIIHNLWQPTWYPNQVLACDALCFYVANWSWDLATYMSFANIWITDTEGNMKLAQATYDATRVPGPSKFINAESKIRELTAQMLSSQPVSKE